MSLDYLEMTPKRLILSCLTHNTKLVKDIKLSPGEILDSIPGINMGRQAGHSSALKQFAEDNPNMSIGVIGMTTNAYNDNYRSVKNMIHINIKSGNNIRGRAIKYLVIENSHMFATNERQNSEKDLLSFLLTHAPELMTVNTRIFKIG